MGKLRDPHIYDQDGTYRTYSEARKRKDKLKSEGFRVKIRKSEDGRHIVYKKNIILIDMQRNKRYREGERR
jgi:hypothetical protein